MKKNTMMRLAAVLLVVTLLTTCAISGTFAKYVSEATGTQTARVAEWDIQLDGAQMQYTNTLTVDLFETTYQNVASADEDKVIAPGTEGGFDFTFKNDSEVNAEYTLTAEVEMTADIPVLFNIGGEEWLTAEEFEDAIEAKKVALDMGAKVEVAVQWKWIFEDNRDQADTALGLKGDDTITVNFALLVEQVD